MNKSKFKIIATIATCAVVLGVAIPISVYYGTLSKEGTFPTNTNEEYANQNVDSVTYKKASTDIQDTSEATHTATYLNVFPISYKDVCNPGDSYNFWSAKVNGNATAASDYGFVPASDIYTNVRITPYIGGVAQSQVSVNPYCTVGDHGRHIFTYVDVVTDGTFQFKIDFTSIASKSSVKILPESRNITPTIEANNVSAIITDVGDYTFVLDDKPDLAYTFMVQYKAPVNVPNGYNMCEVRPGKYGLDFTTYETPNTYVVFKSGTYDVQSIRVLSDNVTIYFEEGCYFRVHSVKNTLLDFGSSLYTKAGISNANILGRALFDFSQLAGGDDSKGIVGINSDKTILEGIIIINSSHWSICVCDCFLPEVRYCMLFNYRTYSDGIMLSNCYGEIPEGSDEPVYARVHHCFSRVGDDGLEVKSTSSHQIDKNYVKFDYNTVWTDKGYAYGLTYESVGSASNIVYEHNSVGFSQADWDPRIGVLVVQMGTNGASEFHNITFDDIEIYKANKQLAVLQVHNEDGAASKDKGTTVYSPEFGGCVSNVKFNNIRYKSLVGYQLWAQLEIHSDEGTKAYGSFINEIFFNNIFANGTKVTSLNASYNGNRASQITGIYLNDAKIR